MPLCRLIWLYSWHHEEYLAYLTVQQQPELDALLFTIMVHDAADLE